jgi:hypothetical protein
MNVSPSHVGGMMVPMSPFDSLLASINSNPYFIGMMMLLLNFGGRFVSLEMTKKQEEIFSNTWVRRSLIFIIIFVGTRNILVAFIMSFVIILCIGYLFNENSSLCLFKSGIPGSTCSTEHFTTAPILINPPPVFPSTQGPPIIPSGDLTIEEKHILKTLQNKVEAIKDNKPQFPLVKEKTNSSINNYFSRMSMLQGFK